MSEFALKTALPAYLREQQSENREARRGSGPRLFSDGLRDLDLQPEMNEIAAYGGFPNRYPHWRFGMEYERLAKGYEYSMPKRQCG